jgi:hypothetical protein
MKRLESYTENKVVAWARKNGVMQCKLSTPGQRGYPDRVFFVKGGRPVLWEAKRKGEKPRKLQARTMYHLNLLGYDVFWTDNHEEAISYLEARLGRRPRA